MVRYNPEDYHTPGTVLSFETDFIQQGEAFLKAAEQSLRITEARMTYVTEQIEVFLTEAVRDNTPVALVDYWHHTRGSLKASTEAFVSRGDAGISDVFGGGGLGGVTEQYNIQVAQDAENPYGTQYAPFVIQGHATKSGGWVTENPYPSAALEWAMPEINAMLDAVARQIAEETVHYLSDYGAAVGAA